MMNVVNDAILHTGKLLREDILKVRITRKKF